MDTRIETDRLELVLSSLEEARAAIGKMSEADRAHLSPKWLAMLDEATEADPWILGFNMQRREDGSTVGQCGFKGPPDEAGCVEIAYAVVDEEQGKGYATESAAALTTYALGHEGVRVVRAHTLPESNASTRVLTKCGFKCLGDVIDPDDGSVWRWEFEPSVADS